MNSIRNFKTNENILEASLATRCEKLVATKYNLVALVTPRVTMLSPVQFVFCKMCQQISLTSLYYSQTSIKWST